MHYEKFQDGTVKCIEDEIPFEVPETWSWTRLGVIFLHNTGKALNSSIKSGTMQKYITTSNVYWDHFELASFKEMPFTDDEMEKCTITKGDLLVCEGGDIGRAAIWDRDYSVCIQNHLHRLRSIAETNIKLYYYIFYLYKQNDMISGNGIGLQGLSSNRLHALLVPFPPYNEQCEIVKSIQSYWSVIEEIETAKSDISGLIQITKSRILDLAICGKLVPQDPNDEPATVLLERIRAEKEELIKQGKIKRDKKESVIFKGEDNSYYEDVPEKWELTTLSEITTPLSLNDGDWILSENMNPRGTVKLIQLGSVGAMQYVNKGFKYITEDTFEKLNCTLIHPGYILINRIISDKMNVCVLPEIDGKLITTVDTCWIAPNEEHYELKYLMYALSAPIVQSQTMLQSAGTTRKRISKNNLIRIFLPFPPRAEQQRIVAAIETYFTLLDQIAESLS